MLPGTRLRLPRRMLIQADHWHPGRPITISVSLATMPKIPWLLNEAKPLKDLAGLLPASRLVSLTLTSNTLHTHARPEENMLAHNLNHTHTVIKCRSQSKTLAEKICFWHVSGLACKQMSDRLNWTVKTVGDGHLHSDKQQTTVDMQILRSREEHASNSYCVLNSGCLNHHQESILPWTQSKCIFSTEIITWHTMHKQWPGTAFLLPLLSVRLCPCWPPAALFFLQWADQIKTKQWLRIKQAANGMPGTRLYTKWRHLNSGWLLWKMHINYLGQLKISTE